MPGGDFLILIFLLWMFLGRDCDAERVIGVLHGQVELCWHNRHLPDVNRIEWVKFNNNGSRRLIFHFEIPNNITCYPVTCQNIHFNLQSMCLILSNLTAKDEGIYEEKTIFKNSSQSIINITLSLLFVSNITVVSSNDTLTLKCEVSGELMLLRWMRDGLPLPADQRFSLSDMNKTVQVSNFTSLDCSTYTCHVSHKNGASHEAHVIINDNITDVCQNKILFKILILVGLVGLIVLLLCLVLCIYKYGCCRVNSPNREATKEKQNQTTTDVINMDEPIYNEPSFVEEAATAAQSGNFLPYVYSSFIKPRAPHQTDQAEDFGYSTIEEVFKNTQVPQTT